MYQVVYQNIILNTKIRNQISKKNNIIAFIFIVININNIAW